MNDYRNERILEVFDHLLLLLLPFICVEHTIWNEIGVAEYYDEARRSLNRHRRPNENIMIRKNNFPNKPHSTAIHNAYFAL